MREFLLILLVFLAGETQAQLADFDYPDFQKADSIANAYKAENLNNLPILAYELTEKLDSEIEKFRAIYTWVSINFKNDHELYLLNKRKRAKFAKDSLALSEWNRSFHAKVFKKLLKDKSTICTGYAYLVSELANLAEIKCKMIDGYGRTVQSNIGGEGVLNHTWNAVKLNGKWYLCDATWSSGTVFLESGKSDFVADFQDGYFLSEPELFAKNHFPLNEKWLLAENKITLNTFLNAPIVYKYAFKHQIIPVNPIKLNTKVSKGEFVKFQLNAPITFDISQIELVYLNGNSYSTLAKNAYWNKEGFLEIKHKFDRTGTFDVHINVGDESLVTYSVKVNRQKK